MCIILRESYPCTLLKLQVLSFNVDILKFNLLIFLSSEGNVSSNGAPWARPGAMPSGPKWGGANFDPPKKRAQSQLPIFDFQPKLLLVGVNLRVGLPIFEL